MVVSFESLKPVSFTASIDFMDEDGKRYSVPVSASADNCVLTYHAFLEVGTWGHWDAGAALPREHYVFLFYFS